MAVGLVGALAPGAQAATSGVAGGQIALYGGSSGVETLNADGTGLASVPALSNSGYPPNWAPDGSRIVAGWSQIQTARVTGSSTVVTLPYATGVRSSTANEDPTYWQDGRFVVFSTGGQLVYGPSDGEYAPTPIFTDTQEPSTVSDVHPTAGPDGTLAFERLDSGGASTGIWTYDQATNTLKNLIASGSSPVYSADGTKLVFTRVVAGWTQLFTANADGTDVQQVTTDAANHLNPTWDPAGGRIAYETHSQEAGGSDDVTSVALLDLATGTSSTLTSQGSKPAWQPLAQNGLVRVYGTGSTAIDTAASRWTFNTTGGKPMPGLITAKSVVLVNKANATYAAPAIALAAEKQAPVLMTSAASLDASASAELKRSLAKGGTVYLDGNTGKLSAKVAGQVTALGYKVLRMDGSDLASVSIRMAKQTTAAPSWVFLADGSEYHDPIAAASAVGALGYHGTGVVITTTGKTLPASVKTYLNSLNPSTSNMVTVGYNATYAMEHTALNKEWSFWGIPGKTNEDVAANLARFWWSSPEEATVEDTWTWQNAVAGQAVTATYGPMLWSTEGTLSPQVSSYLSQEAASVWGVQTFGGNTSYPPANRTAIASAIAAGSAWTTTVWAANGAEPLPAGMKSLRVGTSSAVPSPLSATGRLTAPTAPPGEHLPARDAHSEG
jgi:putative cell wall-binding protein